jgi:hypothetical protein
MAHIARAVPGSHRSFKREITVKITVKMIDRAKNRRVKIADS